MVMPAATCVVGAFLQYVGLVFWNISLARMAWPASDKETAGIKLGLAPGCAVPVRFLHPPQRPVRQVC